MRIVKKLLTPPIVIEMTQEEAISLARFCGKLNTQHVENIVGKAYLNECYTATSNFYNIINKEDLI